MIGAYIVEELLQVLASLRISKINDNYSVDKR